ncbi:hypothetical protein lpari_02450 [Legionella parisiensis]|uniref:Uncharacterized protein n=2 Tax=Legionella parisiensis TaxID=45071 RepID=A0A1E5JPX4_9GAMM|nr:hypothetical protein lpari_02450 [Legionella parisiensis]
MYTGGLSDCVAVSILDMNNNEIQKMMMLHFGGGLSSNSFSFLRRLMREHEFSDTIQVVVCFGTSYKNKSGLLDPEYQKEYESQIVATLGVNCSKIIFTASSSSCITFDGFGGPFAYDSHRFRKEDPYGCYRRDYYEVESTSSLEEKNVFDSMTRSFLAVNQESFSKYLAQISNIIESQFTEPGAKAALYQNIRFLVFMATTNLSAGIPHQEQTFTQLKSEIETICAKEIPGFQNQLNGLHAAFTPPKEEDADFSKIVDKLENISFYSSDLNDVLNELPQKNIAQLFKRLHERNWFERNINDPQQAVEFFALVPKEKQTDFLSGFSKTGFEKIFAKDLLKFSSFLSYAASSREQTMILNKLSEQALKNLFLPRSLSQVKSRLELIRVAPNPNGNKTHTTAMLIGLLEACTECYQGSQSNFFGNQNRTLSPLIHKIKTAFEDNGDLKLACDKLGESHHTPMEIRDIVKAIQTVQAAPTNTHYPGKTLPI